MNTKVNIPLSNCRVCKSSAVEFNAYAVVAPWIERLVGSNEPIPTALLHCPSCDFDFFSHGYTNSQMDSLYSGYRGEKYFQTRRLFEPWFTRRSLDFWNPAKNPRAVVERREYMSETFRLFGVKLGGNCDVLDFGGDLGQFFPSGLTGKKYLFDPSDTAVPIGITRVTSLSALNASLGLVMNCHTLEHLPVLQGQAESMSNLLTNDGYLYLEVPLDRFKTSAFHKTPIYKFYLRFLIRILPLFIVTDLLTGMYRLLFRRIPFWGIVKQSEHLNYFSKKSLLALIGAEVEVIGVTEPDLNFGQGRIRVGRIALFAQKIDSEKYVQ